MSDPKVEIPERMTLSTVAPQAYRAMLHFEHAVHGMGLDPTLYELVKIRASQMNGCAFCIDMHTKDARAEGETEQRIYALNAWRETPFFTARERAGLALAEAITFLHEGQVPDDVYDEARKHFSEPELAALIFATTAINAWNRLAISTRQRAGTYERPSGE